MPTCIDSGLFVGTATESSSYRARSTSPAAMDRDGVVRLLSSILAGTPRLLGVACRQRPGLFDDRHPGETRKQHQ